MFTFSLQTSDNQTPEGAASLMKTRDIFPFFPSRPCEECAFYAEKKHLLKRSKVICSKHLIRSNVSFLLVKRKRIRWKKKRSPSCSCLRGRTSLKMSLINTEKDIYNMIKGLFNRCWSHRYHRRRSVSDWWRNMIMASDKTGIFFCCVSISRAGIASMLINAAFLKEHLDL